MKATLTWAFQIFMLVLLVDVVPASSALAATGNSAAGFQETFQTYQRLSSDPRSTRDQWLKVIHSFVGIHKAERNSRTGTRSLFFAGRSCLSLYRRSGQKADLDEAIKHLNAYVRKHSGGPYLILGLQELKEAHLLKRSLAARKQEALRRAPPAPPIAESKPEPKPAEHSPTRPGPSSPEATASTCTQPEFNCTGNPFFNARQTLPRASDLPVVSDSLPNVPMNELPPLLPSRTAKHAPSADSPWERPAATRSPEPSKESGSSKSDQSRETIAQEGLPSSPQESFAEPFVVVIDPGHGGKDPGAVSDDAQLKEKEITLDVANRARAKLEKKIAGVTVSLTRTGDTFLPLQERTALANSLNADLFVSVHCNAAEDASSQGIETYYLSKASSKKAMAAAARENGIPATRMSDIDATLLDLLMDSKKSESVKLAESVHSSLIRSVAETQSGRRDRGVKRAPFYVLLGAKMPAILVECGFINGRERDKLKNPSFLDSLAEGIAHGIAEYLRGLRHED